MRRRQVPNQVAEFRLHDGEKMFGAERRHDSAVDVFDGRRVDRDPGAIVLAHPGQDVARILQLDGLTPFLADVIVSQQAI